MDDAIDDVTGDVTDDAVDGGLGAGPAWLDFGRSILLGASAPAVTLESARAALGDALFTDGAFAALATNLRLLRETGSIDQALHGLTGAIHLLTARGNSDRENRAA